MKIIGILLIAFFYLRRPIKKLRENIKLNYLISLYDAYKAKETEEERLLAFELIAKNRSLSNELIGSVRFRSPSYKDFKNEEKLFNTYIKLIETFDRNSYLMKKYFNPKYAVKDIFYLPASIFSFLLNHSFKRYTTFILSIFGWIATIIISAYASEIREIIDSIIDKFI